MAFRHASSHGLSVFFCTIISSVLIEFLKPELPKVFKFFESCTTYFLAYIPIPIDPKYFNILVIASFFGIAWGLVFKWRFVSD